MNETSGLLTHYNNSSYQKTETNLLVATRQLETFFMKYAMEHLTTNGTSNANITSTEEHFGELLIKPTLKLHKNHYSGPSAALHVEHLNYTNRATAMHRNGKPCNSLLTVNMASCMDRGWAHTTTATTNDGQHDGRTANTKL